MGIQIGNPIDRDIGIPIISVMDMTVTQAVEALIEHFDGSQVRAAAAIGVRQPTISAWRNDGHGVSAKNALKAEKVTDGAVRAADLCPDLRAGSTAA